jgi:hypothetical protein
MVRAANFWVIYPTNPMQYTQPSETARVSTGGRTSVRLASTLTEVTVTCISCLFIYLLHSSIHIFGHIY